MTITNPVGQQLTPTCHCHSTRGSKQEQNLHTEGRSSPRNPSAGGRASGGRSREIINGRTDRHTRNHWTIPKTFCTTSPSKCFPPNHPPPLPQPRASTTLHPPTPHTPNSPPGSSSSDKCRQNGATSPTCLGNAGPIHGPEPNSAGASSCATDSNSHPGS